MAKFTATYRDMIDALSFNNEEIYTYFDIIICHIPTIPSPHLNMLFSNLAIWKPLITEPYVEIALEKYKVLDCNSIIYYYVSCSVYTVCLCRFKRQPVWLNTSPRCTIICWRGNLEGVKNVNTFSFSEHATRMINIHLENSWGNPEALLKKNFN